MSRIVRAVVWGLVWGIALVVCVAGAVAVWLIDSVFGRAPRVLR
jgi:hypothetical protein